MASPLDRANHFASGEWIARKTDFKDGLVTIAHCGDWRVGVETGIKGGNYRDWDGGSDEAHAHLFAAAPDLLAALEAILAAEIIYTGAITETMEACEMDSVEPLAIKARAAINKALGRDKPTAADEPF